MPYCISKDFQYDVESSLNFDHREKTLSFTMYDVSCFLGVLFQVEEAPLYAIKSFYHERVFNFIQCFFCIY